eukprot:TRINITY_DN1581_c0_g1_i3.p1 TRINITY_DN1581_c0_g1~~TRINITY_DN1581_c0_g1_i3.p1  ORF type:complete len:155 (-),score=29.28 TRINITY_DN1581_c0_g1_i3:66-530(-)
MKVSIVERTPLLVNSILHVGSKSTLFHAWRDLHQWQVRKGVADKMGEMLAACYQNPNDEKGFTYFACAHFTTPVDSDGTIVLQLPGGLYASYEHIGSYSLLAKAFDDLQKQWLPSSGYQLTDQPFIEVYLNTSKDTPENELRTLVQIPIQKKIE